MKLSELRSWFFDIVAILIPGSLTLVALAAAVSQPHNFLLTALDARSLTQTFSASGSVWVSGLAFVVLSFCIGHLLQQVLHYVNVARGRFASRQDSDLASAGATKSGAAKLTAKVFSNDGVREYLLPASSGINHHDLHLTDGDFLNMIYSKYAPLTMEQTFLGIRSFCNGMAATCGIYGIAAVACFVRIFDPGLSLRTVVWLVLSVALAIAFRDRANYYHTLSYSAVINTFLGSIRAELAD